MTAAAAEGAAAPDGSKVWRDCGRSKGRTQAGALAVAIDVAALPVGAAGSGCVGAADLAESASGGFILRSRTQSGQIPVDAAIGVSAGADCAVAGDTVEPQIAGSKSRMPRVSAGGWRVAVAGDAGTGKRPVDVVVKMAAVADPGVAAGVLGRVVASRWRDVVTPLADTTSLRVHIFSLAAGIAEEHLAGLSCFLDVAPDQVDVGSLAAARIGGVVFHVGAMTVGTLDILASLIVVFLAGMAVGAEIGTVRLADSLPDAAPVAAQQVSVTAAQAGKVIPAVNGAAARIGIMDTMAGGTEQDAISFGELQIQV